LGVAIAEVLQLGGEGVLLLLYLEQPLGCLGKLEGLGMQGTKLG
jgi:hypothetical protein